MNTLRLIAGVLALVLNSACPGMAGPPEDWQARKTPVATHLTAVASPRGQLIAVSQAGTILTSTDAMTCALQISGTEHLLRSVIFTGWEFLAGGDSFILLTSGDGISWVTVPFCSFDAWTATNVAGPYSLITKPSVPTLPPTIRTRIFFHCVN